MNESNKQLELARHYVEYTGTNLFLTGKAGTGKTTFLRDLVKRSPKRMVVLAPTGVAAINAGGVTIHSFFQLPFAPFVPGTEQTADARRKNDHKMRKEKINIIRSLDLLVIDEISMVRADLLDAIDHTLRKYRNPYKPFGGLQLLLIGDVQQLAPVVREEEWAMLSQYYSSPYFFHSNALMEAGYVTIELQQVYRQADPKFIKILNEIRENRATPKTLELLNSRYRPNFRPADADEYITLTTHNSLAQRINTERLADLKAEPFAFKAEVSGTFPELAYPTDETLTLKKGAQVMFVKNDPSADKAFYNGKIGTVTAINERSITVRCGRNDNIEVTPLEWENTRYTLNPDTKEIVETVEGTFKQFPLKPAWAITIHKSQGLTFDRAIINAGASFSHGQVYVALSRCRTLEGMILSTPIRPEAIVSDATVASFVDYVETHQPDKSDLHDARRHYFVELVVELFDFQPIAWQLQRIARVFDEHLSKLYPRQLTAYKMAQVDTERHLASVGYRFRAQLHELCAESLGLESDERLQERVRKGAAYFVEKTVEILGPLVKAGVPDVDNKDIAERLTRDFERLEAMVRVKVATLNEARAGFRVSAYLATKAKAAIEAESTNKARRTAPRPMKLEGGSDIKHPALYVKLRSWRKAKADEYNMVIYNIFTQKALLGLANKMPATKAELSAIPGIGKKFIDKHGLEIIAIIDEYREKGE